MTRQTPHQGSVIDAPAHAVSGQLVRASRERQAPAWNRVLQADPCSYCGKEGGTVDHIVPRARGGTNSWTNRTGACPRCNNSKSATSLLFHLLARGTDREVSVAYRRLFGDVRVRDLEDWQREAWKAEVRRIRGQYVQHPTARKGRGAGPRVPRRKYPARVVVRNGVALPKPKLMRRKKGKSK